MSEPDDFSSEVFEAIVRHPTFDPNRPDFDAFPNAPLPLHQAILESFCASSTHVSRAVERLEILLESGADPELQVQDPADGDTFFSPMRLLRSFRDRANEEENRIGIHISEKIGEIMRKHIRQN